MKKNRQKFDPGAFARALLVAAPLLAVTAAGCGTVTGAKETVIDPAKDTNPKGDPGAKTPGAAPAAAVGAARDDRGKM